jgi:tyrosyl-tRNA synthetase
VSLNKEKVDNTEMIITRNHLLNNKYLLVQKGKKNYFLIRVAGSTVTEPRNTNAN